MRPGLEQHLDAINQDVLTISFNYKYDKSLISYKLREKHNAWTALNACILMLE